MDTVNTTFSDQTDNSENLFRSQTGPYPFSAKADTKFYKGWKIGHVALYNSHFAKLNYFDCPFSNGENILWILMKEFRLKFSFVVYSVDETNGIKYFYQDT